MKIILTAEGKVLMSATGVIISVPTAPRSVRLRRPQKIIPCLHRGHSLRKDSCLTCNGKQVETVFQCQLFKECTIRRIKENQVEPKPCIICQDRQEVAYGQAGKADS